MVGDHRHVSPTHVAIFRVVGTRIQMFRQHSTFKIQIFLVSIPVEG